MLRINNTISVGKTRTRCRDAMSWSDVVQPTFRYQWKKTFILLNLLSCLKVCPSNKSRYIPSYHKFVMYERQTIYSYAQMVMHFLKSSTQKRDAMVKKQWINIEYWHISSGNMGMLLSGVYWLCSFKHYFIQRAFTALGIINSLHVGDLEFVTKNVSVGQLI